MDLDTSTLKRQSSLETIDLKFLRKLLQTHPQYSQHKWDTKSTVDFLKGPKDPITQRQTERRRRFEKLIGKLLGIRQSQIKRAIEQDDYRGLLDEHNRLFGDGTMAGQLSLKLNIGYGQNDDGSKRIAPLTLPPPPVKSN